MNWTFYHWVQGLSSIPDLALALTLSSMNVSSVTRISGTESETEVEAGLSGTVKGKGQEGEENFPTGSDTFV